MRTGKKFLWIGLAILVLFLVGYLYSVFFPRYQYVGGGNNTTGLIILGIVLGGVITFLIYRLATVKSGVMVKESSHTIVESMRKVFKIVCAEGQLNELYDYEETKKIFGLIPSTKRALVIVQAKVLIGYDFEKLEWEADEASRKIKLVNFPEPQILSMETDFKYYNFDEHIFNLMGREDFAKIQTNAKKKVEEAAMKSGLRNIAAEQMRTILTEVVHSKNWILENSNQITKSLEVNSSTASQPISTTPIASLHEEVATKSS